LHAQLCGGNLLLLLASRAFGIFSLRLLLLLYEKKKSVFNSSTRS
jgi:hypothetical protein